MQIGTYEIRDPHEYAANYDVAWRYKTLLAWQHNPLWCPPRQFINDPCLRKFHDLMKIRATPLKAIINQDARLHRLSQVLLWGEDSTMGSFREHVDVLLIAGTPFQVMADDFSTRYKQFDAEQYEMYSKLFCDIRRDDGTNVDSGYLTMRAICGNEPTYDALMASEFVRHKFYAHLFGFPGIYFVLKLKSKHAKDVVLTNLQQVLFAQTQTELLCRTMDGRIGSNTLVALMEATTELKRLAMEEATARGEGGLNQVTEFVDGLFNELCPSMVKCIQTDNADTHMNAALNERLNSQQNVAGLNGQVDGRLLALHSTVDAHLQSGLKTR